MELKDTIELMSSSDYRDRFKAEYYQLAIRIKKLAKFIDNNTFKPDNPIDILKAQLEYMEDYLNILKARAIIEKIDLDEVD